jgi:hypothetical protein
LNLAVVRPVGQIQAIPQVQPPEGVGQSLFQDGVAHLLTIQYFARESRPYGGQGALRLLKLGCFPISRAEASEAKPFRWAYSSVGRAADS